MTHADVIEGAALCGRDPRNLHAHTTDVMEGAAHFWAGPSQTGLHFQGGGGGGAGGGGRMGGGGGDRDNGDEGGDYYLSGESGRMIRGQANV